MVTATGTFVSCKDYDDDIKDLQEKVDKLATKEDMTSQIATLQTALTNAAKDASDAITKATAAEAAAKVAGDNAAAAKAAAEKSVAEAKAAAIEAAKAEVAAAQTALEKLVADGLADNKAELEKMAKVVEEAKKSVEAIVGKIADMVTDVELVLTDPNNTTTELAALTATQVKNTFGPNGELSFTKDVQTNFGGSVLVRVSPTNAVVTAESVVFLNSKGEDLNSLIEVGTPKKYEGTLAIAAKAADTGLWEIPYNFKSYTDAAIKAVAYVNGQNTDKGYIAYAIAINNTLSTFEGERNVVSGYDLKVTTGKYTGSDALYFTAGGEKIANLRNRWDGSKATDAAPAAAKEYKWNASLAASNRVDPTKNRALDATDARNTKDYLSVKVGEPFDVVLTDEDGEALDPTVAPYRFYVALDKAFAEDNSEPSELNAWNTYAKNTTGLSTLDENGKVTISINDETAEGDIIGFRVYAVNYDGSLVDPDGKAFYAYVGASAVSTADLTLTTKIESPYDWTKMKSTDKAAFSTADWTRAKGGEYTIMVTDPTAKDADVTSALGITNANFKFYDKNGTDVTAEVFADGTKLAGGAKLTSVTKVEMVGVAAANLKDGVKYTATITVKNPTTKAVVATGIITFTKELPAFPSTLVYPYTEVLISNVLHVYPVASSDKTKGTFDMRNVWHGIALKDTDADWNAKWNNASTVNKGDAVTFNQVLTDAQKESIAKGEYPTVDYTPTDRLITVNAKLVDPNNKNKPLSNFYLNEFPMTVNYNFGYISYAYNSKTSAWVKAQAWNPVGKEFKIVLRNYADDCAISWNGAAPTLYYPGAAEQEDSIALSKIIVKDWYKNNVDLSKSNDYFDANAVKVNLLTGANDATVDEYYSATIKEAKTYGSGKDAIKVPAQIIFTSKVNKSQGNAVPTKLKVTITDKFGYTVSETIAPFTMSFQKP